MATHNGLLLGARDALRVIDCKACGFAHLETLPDASDLARFYADDFWTKEKPGALKRIEEQREWWGAVYGDWLELVERYASGFSIYDVGFGYGLFLEVAQSRGWGINGTEPNHNSRNYAASRLRRMLDPYLIEDMRLDQSPHQFNCISALWLIEHLSDPLVLLRWAHNHIVSGGVLMAVVPNDFSPIQLRSNGRVGKPYYWIDKTHINYFTPESFANLLGRAGFRIVERTTLYPVERFLLDGMDYTIDAKLGAELYDAVTMRDLNMTRPDRIAHYQAMARRGEGREIVIIGVRDD